MNAIGPQTPEDVQGVPTGAVPPPPPSGPAPIEEGAVADTLQPDTARGSLDGDMEAGSDTIQSAMPAGFLPHVDPMQVFDEASDEQMWAASAVSKSRETMTSTSAARGCIDTDLPEAQVAPIFAKLGLKAEQRNSLWVFYGTGERVASTFADLHTELTEISARNSVLPPRAYLDTYSTDSATPIDSEFVADVPHMLSRCTSGSVIISSQFNSLLKHPRVEIYIHKKVKGRGEVQGKSVFLLSEFKSVINELRAGGAEKQYGREKEMQEMLNWMSKFMGAEIPMFSSFTVHGDAMFGKTRIAEEMIKAIRAIQARKEDLPKLMRDLLGKVDAYAKQPGRAGVYADQLRKLQAEFDALPKTIPRVIFVPAKDTRMGDSLSFFRTYAKQILNAAREVFDADALPDSCKDLEKIESLDATALAKEGPAILALGLRRLRRSGQRFLIVTDDMQWADSESCDLLRKTFSVDRQKDNNNFGHLALLNLTRTGDQVMNEELLRVLQSSPNPGNLTLKPLPFLDASGVPTPLMISFVYGLLKADPSQTSIDAIVFERLAKAVGGAQGNPGQLTEMINGMVQEGVLTVKRSGVTFDDRFLNWTTMGEADVLAAARVDRLLAKPLQKEVLRYIVFLRETGDCTFQFIRNFFKSHLKRPDLFAAFGQMGKQGIFNMQTIEEENDNLAIIGFARDADERRLKSVLGGSALQDEESIGAYKEIARYMYFTHTTLSASMADEKNAANRDAFLVVLDRCSPQAIFAMAAKAKMPQMVNNFVVDAFKDAYARGQYDVALSVYEYIKNEPALGHMLIRFSRDVDLQLDLIQCMQVKRSAYAPEIEVLGDRVRFFYAGKTESLGENQMLALADYKRIERLHDLMCDFYFLRGSDPKVRKVSVAKLDEWGSGMAGYLAETGKNVFGKKEIQFMQLKEKFNKLRGEYLMKRYAQACEDHASIYEGARDSLLREFPEFAQDIRFQRVDLEGSRIFANAFHMGWNRILSPGGDGYHADLTYDDDDAATIAAMYPGNSIHDNVKMARVHYHKFFQVAQSHPEYVVDRTQVYRSKKSLGTIEGKLGNFSGAMQWFFDSRSDCIKFGDNERFADVVDAMGSTLCKLVLHFQTNSDPALLQQMNEIALMIQRNERGAVLPNQHPSTVIYFILKWAAHYSALAADTQATHQGYQDIALINLLGTMSAAASTATVRGDVIDDPSSIANTEHLNYALADALRRITQIPAGKEKSFLSRHRELDKQGQPSAIWSLHIAPYLASLIRNMARLQTYPQLIDAATPSDPENPDRKATLADAVPMLVDEIDTMFTENGVVALSLGNEKPPLLKMIIPQYVAVVDQKIADISVAQGRVAKLFRPKQA